MNAWSSEYIWQRKSTWDCKVSQIEMDRQIRTCSCVFILSVTAFRWPFEQSAGFNQTSKTCMASVNSIIWGCIWITTAQLCLTHWWMKCMSLYFSGANHMPWCLAHQSHWKWVLTNHWQLFSVNSSQAISVMSFTNSKRLISLWRLTHHSSNSAL